jgi:hypothetical protein
VNLNNRNLYASYNTAEILSSYLNMEDEDIGGIFNQPQLLVSNVRNGFGYWTIADVVGGKYQE